MLNMRTALANSVKLFMPTLLHLTEALLSLRRHKSARRPFIFS
ncbi:Transketolase [Legionella pneumophila subsp. pneumophila LPE509]|nr:Transketolase [Legionella pneumophila subsp. pneumophila LPE509]